VLFLELSRYLKRYLNSQEPIPPLLSSWLTYQLKQETANSNATRILQSEFALIEIGATEGQSAFLISPKSERAGYLLEMLRDYTEVMEQTRSERLQQKSSQDSPKRKTAKKDKKYE